MKPIDFDDPALDAVDGDVAVRAPDDRIDFSSALATFKRRGSCLLITGAVPRDVRERAFRKLAGSADEDRKRILVDDPGRADGLLPPGVSIDGADVTVLSSTAALPDLRTQLLDAVVAFDEAVDGLVPGQLRLLCAGLPALAADRRATDVTRFLRATATIVRGARGLGFVAVPDREDDELPGELSRLFEGRIELRGTTAPEMRWHIPVHDLTSTWIDL